MFCQVNSSIPTEELFIVPTESRWYITTKDGFNLVCGTAEGSLPKAEVNAFLAWSHDVNENSFCVMPRCHSFAALYVMLSLVSKIKYIPHLYKKLWAPDRRGMQHDSFAGRRRPAACMHACMGRAAL